MALYRAGGFTPDDWSFPTDDEPLPAGGAIALPRARLLAEQAALVGRNDPIGLILESGEKLEGLEALIPRLRLIVLRLPKYSDGRQYSIARRLRDNYDYQFELRATGDVLQDQIQILQRAGFDALEITHPGTIAALRDNRVVGVSRHYQPASVDAREIRPNGRPWLRISNGRAGGVRFPQI